MRHMSALTPEEQAQLERERASLIERCETLLGRVRRAGDSDAKARSRLQATERQALDRMRDQVAELTNRLEGQPPSAPTAR